MNLRGTRYWAANLAAAVILLVLLVAHMFTMHLDGLLSLIVPQPAPPLSWERVLARARDGLYTSGYLVLLGAGLYHGFYGLRTVLLEFWSSPRAARVISLGCIGAGLTLFVLGAATTVYFHFTAGG